MPYRIRVLIDYKPTGPVLAQSERQSDVMDLWLPGVTALCWDEPYREIRRWSDEAKASARRKRLTRRINAKFPLLAPILLEQEGITPDPVKPAKRK